MNNDVEFHIQQNYPWSKVPPTVKQSIGNSQREYEKLVVAFSIKNQLRYKVKFPSQLRLFISKCPLLGLIVSLLSLLCSQGNLVRHIRKDERKYYEDLLEYSRSHLMLYPYHLSGEFLLLGEIWNRGIYFIVFKYNQ